MRIGDGERADEMVAAQAGGSAEMRRGLRGGRGACEGESRTGQGEGEGHDPATLRLEEGGNRCRTGNGCHGLGYPVTVIQHGDRVRQCGFERECGVAGCTGGKIRELFEINLRRAHHAMRGYIKLERHGFLGAGGGRKETPGSP